MILSMGLRRRLENGVSHGTLQKETVYEILWLIFKNTPQGYYTNQRLVYSSTPLVI